VLFEKKNMTIY